jgi:hypothetical protein
LEEVDADGGGRQCSSMPSPLRPLLSALDPSVKLHPACASSAKT